MKTNLTSGHDHHTRHYLLFCSSLVLIRNPDVTRARLMWISLGGYIYPPTHHIVIRRPRARSDVMIVAFRLRLSRTTMLDTTMKHEIWSTLFPRPHAMRLSTSQHGWRCVACKPIPARTTHLCPAWGNGTLSLECLFLFPLFCSRFTELGVPFYIEPKVLF